MIVTNLHEIGAAFESAFNSGDLEALVSLYEKNCVFTPQPGVRVEGSEAVRQALKGFLESGMKMKIEPLFHIVAGDLALCSSKWTLTGGGLPEMSGRTAEVLHRGADGGWRYLIDNPYSS
jgi:ketosteroid isomerase-like protein